VREYNVYSETVPHDITAQEIEAMKEEFNVKGLILSGGPASVYERDAPKCTLTLLELNLPMLGLCYGHQLIAHMAEGKVKPATRREYGVATVIIDRPLGVLKGLNRKEKVWMSHGDTVFALPGNYEALAHSENTPVAAFRSKEKPIYGLQWHPEVVHTEHGALMLHNFVFNVCKCEPNWLMEDFIKTSVEEIKQTINGSKAIVALSGGIDSSTVTALAAQALGKNLTAVFVDHGFMRKGEPEFVEHAFGKLDLNFVSVNTQERFLQKLKGILDPEEKRKIIGREFVRVFETQARTVGAEYLIQGTIYPDRIEARAR